MQVVAALSLEHGDDKTNESEHGNQPTDAQGIADVEAVFAGQWVVAIAEQQELIDRIADGAVGCFDEAPAQVARGVVDAVEIARQFAFRRQHHQAAGVDVLVGVFVVFVAKADGCG